MISKNTIDKVYETARIEEVIGDFVQLKKSGANFKGLSPFTDERSPSFMVSPVKQIWKDFSSGKGGNVVAFVMEHEHFTYPEAIKYLAKKYQIEIEETVQTDAQKEAANERESMYLVSEYAQTYFSDILWNSSLGKAIGLSYFKERGFTEETIRRFGLGYCLDEWDGFTKAAIENQYSLKYLEATGLTIVKPSTEQTEAKSFDRFKGRVMFPIHSMSGRVLGFGGRILTQDKKAAKYLNSPESEIYNKSKVLYGIYLAKQSIAKLDNCYLVEGYTDVIQMYQQGVQNVVSSSGTALTPDQIRLISRLTKNITVLFDGDAAGLRASLRGIDLILEQGMNVKICTFPEGEDPDSFAKAHTEEEIRSYFESHSQDFIQFKASLLATDSGNDPVKRADTIRDIVGSIAKIPDAIKQEVYLQSCAQIMDISEQVLFNTMAQISKKELREAQSKPKFGSAMGEPTKFQVHKPEAQAVEKLNVQWILEKKIIEILLLYGQTTATFEDLILESQEEGALVLTPKKVEQKVYEKVYLDLQEDEIELTQDHFKHIYFELIQAFNESESFSLPSFISNLDPELATAISSILMEEEKYQLGQWEKKNIFPKDKSLSVAQLVTETILSLRCFLIKKRMEHMQTLTADPEKDHQETKEELVSYLQLYSLLNKKLNRVLA
ncbi:MAG: DNA primase [Flavobacteriaceae bacterium]|nr:DNA primase [Flavobacteriaceae bacterium]MCI5088557.1 DNA primase [Flavobacteriaceae bacterium]CAI8173168.1 MAG: DNA primase [SAR116 cluster bacterium]